ncbi:electron transport complex protein RnfC [Tissierella praeacuta DSM 18095]|uniref:Ion-translocating oxidoreductase complex subunit C n=1 Tax=Tissierella praeacuta DSM 18095 TaxID=1123404 RepID=A0A1M4S674_9FIRM|nr:electron transport complex subunit RsxC [Tissierella praeacuta]TCU71640.1 electron transport complex protein RnfC [Tissierella praeacuta]SHE27698.1 electron transport complex protein RnfC [Tissierella praeacuta DSM 18095]SUP00960.1 Nitrogen fixation protein rnfC [Tissierella praeacuta]
MKLDNLTFKGGVNVPHNKELTEKQALEYAKEPSIVYIPLHQHTGAPCEAIVNVGDRVKVGQKIGESQAFVSAPIHSSIAGTVKNITTITTPTGISSKCIVIESDGSNEKDETIKPRGNLDKLSSKEIIEIVKEAGITGMGGAGFPTHVKLSPPPDKTIDTVIINGAECEPFLTSDHRLMLEMPEKVIFGLRAIMKALNVEKGFIGIESNKMDAVNALKSVIKPEYNIDIVTLKVKYPQGDEKRLINAITGRKVPSGGLPMDVSCVVNNVSTAKAIAEAILEGKPLYERVVTVTGNGVNNPKNLVVKIGTPFQEVIGEAGGFNGVPGKVIMGGPMMGLSQFSTEVPVIKGSGGILVLTEKEALPEKASPCIKCGKCIDACPVHLQPLFISAYALKKDFQGAEKCGVLDCVECGSCSFICPAKRPLVESIRFAKREVLSKRKKS